ncbi:DNA repair rad50 [Babesia ovis]|uniref:DNA repair rad50 n=1 Tax=Babesia ovis TaxID=5869 RepID=A0A9W5TDX3_BABOV|nr:DNA repair rad50 [Babesia ovis]
MGLSGILPPNSDRGKSFVHDCKLSEEREVRAQITLSVETHNKDMVHATRKYSIIRDKSMPNKSTFKAGETLMRVRPVDGEETSVGMKPSDLDNSLPSIMGLSKALIDSVIFCHQDESNWALDDVAKVKAKFDHLLETSRYTKAMAALNKTKREQDEAIKREKSKLELAKAQVAQVADLKNQISTNTEAIAQAKTNIASLENELLRLHETSNVLRKEYEAARAVFNEVRQTSENIERLTNDINTMQQSMSEIYEEGLDEMKHFHQKLGKELAVRKFSSESAYNSLTLEVDQLMDHMNGLHQKINMGNAVVNNRVVIGETIKTTTEGLNSVVKDIYKEMELDNDSQFDEDMVLMYIEQLEVIDQDDPSSKALADCKNEMVTLESKILELTTKEGAQNVLERALEAEINEVKQQAKGLEVMLNTQNQKETIKSRTIEELSEHQERLRNLLAEREQLAILAIKLKNSIDGVTVENENDVRSAIKFLESVINNDRHQIRQYVQEVLGTNVDETDLAGKLKECFALYIQDGVPTTGDTIASDVENRQRFQQDCVTAIVQMINHTENWHKHVTDGTAVQGSQLEPYNPLLKIVTSIRISEYIAYYKALLKPEAVNNVESDVSCDEIKAKLNEIDAAILDVESKITSANTLLTQLDVELKQLVFNIEKIGNPQDRIIELESTKQQSDDEMEKIRRSIEDYRMQQQAKRREYEELNAHLTSLKSANMLKSARLTSLIERYREAKWKLEKANQEFEALKVSDYLGDNLQEELKTVTEKINQSRIKQKDLLQMLNNQRQMLEQLDKNIAFKLMQQQLQEARNHLRSTQEKMGPRTEEEFTVLINQTNEKCGRISVEIATLRGSVITREDNIAKLQQLLESNSYKHVHQNYSDILLALKSHTLAREDLEIYTKTLEKKLHQFHSEKIAQINTVLKRVWREVYTGSNVDYIEIQSNVDDVVPSTGLAPRSYNYRMVMVTHTGVEMDMRGRCSAGERVLASLILRITLTEAFCTNCNILALDEPTTNLDRDNVASLEASLAKLVNDCSINFQLVIITHDEPFARKMALRCNCDKYYKIRKNNKNESVIDAVPFLASTIS